MSETNRSKVYKGIRSQTIITVILGLLEVVYFSIMSRLLTQEDFGFFAVITAVTAVLQTLTEAGLGSSLIQKKNPTKEYVSTAFTLSLYVGIFFAILLVVTAELFSKLMIGSDYLTTAFRLMAIPLFLSNMNSIARAMMMRKLDFFRFGIYQVIAYVISSSIGITMAYYGHGFYSIITVAIVNQVCVSFILYVVDGFYPGIKIYRDNMKGILTYGGWLTGSAIVRSITEQLDKLILSRWLSVSALGAFNRPSGFISRILSQINGVFDTILYPILSNLQDDIEKIKVSYTKAISLTILYSLILTYLFILGSKAIIIIFFGSDWLNLNYIFQIVSISILFLCYSRIADCFFRSMGIVKKYFWNRVITCALTVVSLYVGCQYGIEGAAWALVISRFVDVAIKVVLLRSNIKISRCTFYLTILRFAILPTFLFLICIPILKLSYGSFIAVAAYLSVIAVLALIKPYLFGEVFVNNIYQPLRAKLIK